MQQIVRVRLWHCNSDSAVPQTPQDYSRFPLNSELRQLIHAMGKGLPPELMGKQSLFDLSGGEDEGKNEISKHI